MKLAIKGKLTLAFLFVLIPFLVLQVINIRDRSAAGQRAVLQAQVGGAQAMASAMDAFLADVVRTEEVAGLAVANNPDIPPDQLSNYLSLVRAQRPFVRTLVLTAPDGKVIAADPATLVGLDLSDRPDVQAVLRGSDWKASNLEPGGPLGGSETTPYFSVSIGIRLGSQLLNVVCAGIEARSLLNVIPKSTDPQSVVVVTDATGKLVLESQRINLAWDKRGWISLPPVQAALAGQISTHPGFPSPVDGRQIMGAQVPVASLGWSAGLYRPVAEAMAPVEEATRRDILILVGIFALTLVLIQVLSSLITGPIRALTAHAGHLSQGQLDEAIRLRTGDELETLADAFNQMSASLNQNIAALRAAQEEVSLKSQQLQQILQRTNTITEDERKRIAFDIHDGVIQYVISAGYELQSARRLLKTKPDKSAAHLATARQLMDHTVTEMRRIVFDLHPTALESLGLYPALEKYAANFQQTSGIRCTASLAGTPVPLSSESQVAIYRIVQEALTNVRRHAQATVATITVTFISPPAPEHPGRLIVVIADNGVGFTPADQSRTNGHLGLISMAERAESLGGTLRVESTPGHGTCLTLDVPIPSVA